MEHLFVIGRNSRFEKEYFNKRTCVFSEMKSRLYNLGVVENHESALRKIACDVGKHVLRNVTMIVNKQLTLVALGQRKLCDALIGVSRSYSFYPDMFLYPLLCIENTIYDDDANP